MHLEFLVEEPSCEAALHELLPRMIDPDVTFRVHPHQGKHDLLNGLPNKLRGYKHWIKDDYRIVVLVDLDAGDCRDLKKRLDTAARQAGLRMKRETHQSGAFQILNRIAIDELEAWFLGDVAALHQAYPRVPETLASRKGFTDPDGVRGGTAERLGQVLKRAGYYRGRMPKIEVARRVAGFMDPPRNRSHSFQVFRAGLHEMLGMPEKLTEVNR